MIKEESKKAFKVRISDNNIKVPGMALRSNAGLPITYYLLTISNYGRKYEKSNSFCGCQ